ncbi:MAG: hypothetical protein Q8R61_03325 [Thiobacillus sp.]|uniref:hypothetical protein n=1 Tax=Thiobacillus sp. TaxID=924 RepID=UPI00273521D9|nr:hypothetical protein [Thiobacillus sp.]MDP3584131.1 hypothetical protein [Thiobacillus sp.]
MIDFAKTKTHCSGGILLLAALLLCGCGELAYKRGATSSDLEAAKKSCREKGPNPATVEQCMADHGWVVQNLSRMEPLDADPVVEASVIPSDRRIENAAGATQPATAVKRKPEMTDTFKVSSWWKTGSGAVSLKTDTEACVAKLGEAHRPDSQTQSATQGLLLCMKGKGWSGLRAK